MYIRSMFKVIEGFSNMKEHLKGNIEKIGVTEWLEVKKHSRVIYLKIRPEDVNIYDIRMGDNILVELKAIKRLPRDDDLDEQG